MRIHLLLSLVVLAQLPSPRLRIEAPPELSAIRTRLESIDPLRFTEVAQRVGLTGPLPTIRVILATEQTDWARSVSAWVAGFAIGASNLVVVFPSRSPSYPDATLEDVLRHEVAHVLIWHASGGRPVPRWFNEGLAMSVERRRWFGDQTQLLYQLISGSRTDLEELDQLFSGSQNDQTRAYALAGAIMRDISGRYGPAAPGEILSRVARGDRFDDAFSDVTRLTLNQAEAQFWDNQRVWTTWVPIIVSSTTLWLVVTLLAIFAIYVRRRRNRRIEEEWEKEDIDDLDPDR